jgi:signal transduction histidine kinase
MFKEAEELFVFLMINTAAMLLFSVLFISLVHIFRERQSGYLKHVHALECRHRKVGLRIQSAIREQTMQLLSSELHDNIGLSLSLARMQLAELEKKIAGVKKELSGEIKQTSKLIGSAISDLTYLSRSLSPAFIGSMGLISAIRFELEKISTLGRYKISFVTSGELRFLDDDRELSIFRMVQELLHNSIKYAEASELSLALKYQPEELQIFISDNGIGIKSLKPPAGTDGHGSGIVSIRKRAQMLLGRCDIISAAGQGTRVHLFIPYKSA